MSDIWETIRTVTNGRSPGVRVAWRQAGDRQAMCLIVSLGGEVTRALGMTEVGHDGKRGRVVVQRNRMRGRLRIRAAVKDDLKGDTRAVSWKNECATINVPLDDVALTEKKPAQDTAHTFEGKCVEIKLPHWAVTGGFVQVSGGRAA